MGEDYVSYTAKKRQAAFCMHVSAAILANLKSPNISQ